MEKAEWKNYDIQSPGNECVERLGGCTCGWNTEVKTWHKWEDPRVPRVRRRASFQEHVNSDLKGYQQTCPCKFHVHGLNHEKI